MDILDALDNIVLDEEPKGQQTPKLQTKTGDVSLNFSALEGIGGSSKETTRVEEEEEEVDFDMDYSTLGNIDLTASDAALFDADINVGFEGQTQETMTLEEVDNLLDQFCVESSEGTNPFLLPTSASASEIEGAPLPPPIAPVEDPATADVAPSPSSSLPPPPAPLEAAAPFAPTTEEPARMLDEPQPVKEGKKIIFSVYLVDHSCKKIAMPEDCTAKELMISLAHKIHLTAVEYFGLVLLNTDGDLNWLAPNENLLSQGVTPWVQGQVEENKVYMKILYFKRMLEKYADPIADHLFYLQIKDEIVSGKYYVSEPVAVRLGSFQVQQIYGDHVPSKHKPGFLDELGISSFLPAQHVKSNSSQYWQKRLFSLHRKYTGMSQEEAEKRYWDLSRQLPSFGAKMFKVIRVGPPPQYTESPVLLGVAEDGLIYQENTHTDTGGSWVFVPYEDVRTISIRVDDPTVMEIQKPNAQMEMLMDQLVFKGPPHAVTGMAHMLREYRYLLAAQHMLPQQRAAILDLDPEGNFGSYLPDPRLFDRPMPRSLLHPERSRLETFKREYIKSCVESNSKPIPKVYLRVDNALDNGTQMDVLDLTNCGLDSNIFSVIAKAINKTFAPRDDDGGDFTENFNISTLNISDCDIFPQAFNSLSMMLETSTVRRLELSKTRLSNSVDQFADCLTMTLVNPKTMERVMNARVITELVLSSNTLKTTLVAKILGCFKGSRHLQTLDLKDNLLEDSIVEHIAPFLTTGSALSFLDLSQNKLSDKGLIGLAEAMKGNTNPKLHYLALNFNKFSSSGASLLGDALFKLGSLETLKLSRNSLSPKFASSVAGHLTQQSSLQTLALNKCGLEKKGCREIAKALGSNRTLTSLNLSNNGLDDEGAKLLSQSVGDNSSAITSLTLMNNPIGSKGLLHIVKALTVNANMSSLDLSFCKVGVDVLKKLSEVLPTHTSLSVLGLIGNEFGKQGGKYIAAIIQSNSSLKKLYIDNNKIPDKNAEELGEALAANQTLQLLSMKDNLLSKDGIVQLLEGMGQQTGLRQLELTGNPGGDYKADLIALAKKLVRTQCSF